ncbi:uncharacterized protein LOC122368511 isoform X2 [Amphibalanus amphitrite]|uniref:uncharacterized protein LOC122368511 isoform X2 n=1 Tax=Amphibalanus amphitrite TaxID=1232801 RepID=UPI001C91B705|nr:uncharacterized protein LOC122368511 isoform X2 [Amphibalanus amphitrite]
MTSPRPEMTSDEPLADQSSDCPDVASPPSLAAVEEEPIDSPERSPGGPEGPESDSDSEDSDSGQSGVSNISGLNWKPNAGPICWVQDQIGAGVDPREVLHTIRPGLGPIPGHIDDITLWKLVIEILSEPPRREKLRHVNTLSDVVRLIRGATNVIVLTGAGVSVSCGIPDFRSRDGIYARLAVDFPDLPDPQAMFDIHYFRRDPRPFFKFAREIYPGQFKPSPCHRFIRMLERQGKLLRNYTQNIDTLEQQAGIENVIQCHGSFATASCQRCRYRVPAEEIREDIFQQRIPACPRCPASASVVSITSGSGRNDSTAAGGGSDSTAAGSGSDSTAPGGGRSDSTAPGGSGHGGVDKGEDLKATCSSADAATAGEAKLNVKGGATEGATCGTTDATGGAAAGVSSSATPNTSSATDSITTAAASTSSNTTTADSSITTPASTSTHAPTQPSTHRSASVDVHDVFVASATDSADGEAMAAAAAAADASDVIGVDEALTHGAEAAMHGKTHQHGNVHGHGVSHGHRSTHKHGERHGHGRPHQRHEKAEGHDEVNHHSGVTHHHGATHESHQHSHKHHRMKSQSSHTSNSNCEGSTTSSGSTKPSAHAESASEISAKSGEDSSRIPTVSSSEWTSSEQVSSEQGHTEERTATVDEDTADSGFAASTREAEDDGARPSGKDDRPPSIMKPDIVFFGEGLPDEFHRSMELDRERCDLLIIIGSSLKVRPVALIPSSVNPDVAQILINREPLPHLNCDVQLLGDCDVIVHHLCHLLGGSFSELLTGDGDKSPTLPLRELTELPPRPAPSAPSSPLADPTNENDTDALRHCWQRKLKESVAARLPEGTYLHQPPSRYIFPGAEVLVDPDDSDSDRDSLDSDRGSDDESPTADGDHLNNSTDTPETGVTPPHTDSCPPTPPGRTATSGASSGAPGTCSTSTAEEETSATPTVNPSSTSDIEKEPETVGSSGSALKRPISETLGEEESDVKRPAFGGGGEPGVSSATAKTTPATAPAGDSGGAQSASENATGSAEAIS